MRGREHGRRAQRRARWVGLVIVVLFGLGLCTLRFRGMQSARDDAYDVAVDELAEAVSAPPSEGRFDEAREAADHLARTGATLLDARATFVLKVVSDVERVAGGPEPGDEASRYDRVAWLIAEGRLEDARAVLAEAESDPDLDRERVALYVTLVEDLMAASE